MIVQNPKLNHSRLGAIRIQLLISAEALPLALSHARSQSLERRWQVEAWNDASNDEWTDVEPLGLDLCGLEVSVLTLVSSGAYMTWPRGDIWRSDHSLKAGAHRKPG